MYKKRYYDPEFKREAVRLVLEDGRRVSEVERSLGITIGVLKNWVKNRQEHDREPQGGQSATVDAKRTRELERQLARVTEERDILKKAVAVFSSDPNRYLGS
jgi:transposase